MSLCIGVVGKPSAGKSSFLNAATSARAKVGNFPFTTIEPNRGVAYIKLQCPCRKYGKQDQCDPRWGRCERGIRNVPVQMLDVAGLVPGAAVEGRGLGNKFLDDLRHADVLLHIVDASGCTNSDGEATVGHDPLVDVEWFEGELTAWILGNVRNKWGPMVRRYSVLKAQAAPSIHALVSGYGAKLPVVVAALERMGVSEPAHLETWGPERVADFVAAFLEVRFPIVVVLNKADRPEAARNIARICKKLGSGRQVVVASARAEIALRKAVKRRLVRYEEGDEQFISADDEKEEVGSEGSCSKRSGSAGLESMDEKTRETLEYVTH